MFFGDEVTLPYLPFLAVGRNARLSAAVASLVGRLAVPRDSSIGAMRLIGKRDYHMISLGGHGFSVKRGRLYFVYSPAMHGSLTFCVLAAVIGLRWADDGRRHKSIMAAWQLAGGSHLAADIKLSNALLPASFSSPLRRAKYLSTG